MDQCLILLAENFWLKPDSYWAIARVLLGLGAVIFVHELGHFLVAKACGVKCEKFLVGFDVPIRLFGQTIIPGKLVSFQWGETEYGIGAIPLGGYVKMLGQDDNPGNIEEQIKESIIEGESADSAYLDSGLVDRTKLDPRSFLAKSVIQRMCIISAGVVFNLIFAVLFAALAFKSGVDYEPPMIGSTIGGGPAWVHGLTGGEPVQIGDSTVEGYYTYMDFAQEIMLNGDEKPLQLTYKPFGSDSLVTAELTPQRGYLRQADDLPLLGIKPRSLPVLSELGTVKGAAAEKAKPPLMPGDRIVEVNGESIENDIQLRRALARDADQVATFIVERETGIGESKKVERITSQVPRNPMRVFGFSVQWQPIAAIKMGSPAETAGLKIGDEVVTVNGQPRGDILTFDARLIAIARAEGSVELGVLRDSEEITISIKPIVPKLLAELGPNKPLAIDSLGVAIPLSLTVEKVETGAGDLQVGDQLVSVKYLLTDEQAADEAYEDLAADPLVNFVDDTTSWAEVASLMQALEPGTKLELTVKRGEAEKKIQLSSIESNEFFQEKRGISLAPMKKHYASKTWGDAFRYGALQVKNDASRVGKTLLRLIRGKISPKNLGGPGTIAIVATSEATQGTSRLLLFLTFLSANLAIVNFLPIPILDGGHMLFLAYEGIFRRPVSENVQLVLTYAGLLMILGLMLFVISLDIGRIWSMV